jgi:hypothetical protein
MFLTNYAEPHQFLCGPGTDENIDATPLPFLKHFIYTPGEAEECCAEYLVRFLQPVCVYWLN